MPLDVEGMAFKCQAGQTLALDGTSWMLNVLMDVSEKSAASS